MSLHKLIFSIQSSYVCSYGRAHLKISFSEVNVSKEVASKQNSDVTVHKEARCCHATN